MKSRRPWIWFAFLVLLVGAAGIVLFDMLLAQPGHLEGIIVEKVFVPAQSTSGTTPYGGAKRGKYFVSVYKEDQWIMLAQVKNGEVFKVHCTSRHYDKKQVGDIIHFSRYEGKLFHIEYFAHNEGED